MKVPIPRRAVVLVLFMLATLLAGYLAFGPDPVSAQMCNPYPCGYNGGCSNPPCPQWQCAYSPPSAPCPQCYNQGSCINSYGTNIHCVCTDGNHCNWVGPGC
jgi:hypothetical protein